MSPHRFFGWSTDLYTIRIRSRTASVYGEKRTFRALSGTAPISVALHPRSEFSPTPTLKFSLGEEPALYNVGAALGIWSGRGGAGVCLRLPGILRLFACVAFVARPQGRTC